MRSWMIWATSWLHISWGIIILSMPLSERDQLGGVSWNSFIAYGGITLWGWIMLVGGILAILAMSQASKKGVGMWTLAMLVPQQAALTIGAVGMALMLLGLQADFEPSRVFRVAVIGWGFFLFHTLNILDLHGVLDWIKQRWQ